VWCDELLPCAPAFTRTRGLSAGTVGRAGATARAGPCRIAHAFGCVAFLSEHDGSVGYLVAPAYTVDEALADERVAAHDMIVDVDHPVFGSLPPARKIGRTMRVFALRRYHPSARRVYQPALVPATTSTPT
jgi:hypothetical protein